MEMEPMASIHHYRSFLSRGSCSQTGKNTDSRCMNMYEIKIVLINNCFQFFIAIIVLATER